MLSFALDKHAQNWESLEVTNHEQHMKAATKTKCFYNTSTGNLHNSVKQKKSVNYLVNIHYTSRVSNQNGVSLLYIMLEIHHSGPEPST